MTLKGLCHSGENGTFYLTTEKGHWGQFVIRSGNIVDIRFRSKRGNDAIEKIADAEQAKYSFSSGDFGAGRQDDAPQDLPETNEILSRLLQAVGKSAPEAADVGGKSRILVVEDSSMTRKVIKRSLEMDGYEVVEAEDGYHALAELHHSKPDLVLLDLILPGMDGYEVLGKIREDQALSTLPVIILTSRDSLLDKARGKFSDSDAYLTKPFSPEELLSQVKKHLRQE